MPPIHVILSEDDQILREVLLEAFAEEEWETTVCDDLSEIKAAIAQHPSAVVLSDSWRVELGQDLSPEYAAEIRTLAQRAPLLLLHSWSSAQCARAQELGAAVLPKPFDLAELTSTVRLLAARTASRPHPA